LVYIFSEERKELNSLLPSEWNKCLIIVSRRKLKIMSHLTEQQRYTIESLLSLNKSNPFIATHLGVDKTVIYREIKRNCDQRSFKYCASLAQKKYDNRMRGKPKHISFSLAIENSIKALLTKDQFSPEQIYGYLNRTGQPCVSIERIYQFIWCDKKRKGSLHKHLRHKGRKYRKRGALKDSRGLLKNRVNISKRPSEVERNDTFGHLECDLIVGENHKGAVLTMNDRTSGMLWMRKVLSKDAGVVTLAMRSILEEIKPYIKSITSDNGKEFAQHQKISEDYCDFYFADPYSPWQRGANENLNGLVRQYIPKSSDIQALSDQYIQSIQEKINNRPRKRLNYQTPIFVMENLLFNQKVALVT
jgi:IS30 family transposase